MTSLGTYLHEVLGVRSVLRPSSRVRVVPFGFISVRVASETPLHQSNKPLWELFLKIKSSVGQGDAPFVELVVSGEDLKQEIRKQGFDFSVVFLSPQRRHSELGIIQEASGQKWIFTVSPQECLKSPASKKILWDHIKGLAPKS